MIMFSNQSLLFETRPEALNFRAPRKAADTVSPSALYRIHTGPSGPRINKPGSNPPQ